MKYIRELVQVLDQNRLLDSESMEHCYWSTKVHSLSPGFYIVSWPDTALRRRYDELACFTGPFATYAEALRFRANSDAPHRT